jgi:hypothetical protein
MIICTRSHLGSSCTIFSRRRLYSAQLVLMASPHRDIQVCMTCRYLREGAPATQIQFLLKTDYTGSVNFLRNDNTHSGWHGEVVLSRRTLSIYLRFNFKGAGNPLNWCWAQRRGAAAAGGWCTYHGHDYKSRPVIIEPIAIHRWGNEAWAEVDPTRGFTTYGNLPTDGAPEADGDWFVVDPAARVVVEDID